MANKVNISEILQNVFSVKEKEKVLVIYDLPKDSSSDTKLWEWRREFAKSVYRKTKELKIKSQVAYYNATYANNADFPEKAFLGKKEIGFDELMKAFDVVIALTEFSATAPLKYFAKKYGIRAASMPGFNEKMIPALCLDYKDVAIKVGKIHDFLLDSEYVNIMFSVNGKEYPLILDIRNRTPKKDDGNCRERGTVINLPSGEAFIVPYEGEFRD